MAAYDYCQGCRELVGTVEGDEEAIRAERDDPDWQRYDLPDAHRNTLWLPCDEGTLLERVRRLELLMAGTRERLDQLADQNARLRARIQILEASSQEEGGGGGGRGGRRA